MEKQYIVSKEDCEKNIHGVCEGCGGKLSALETVDNSGNPTFWQGCEHCCCFRVGVDKKYFSVARKLIEEGELILYRHMDKTKYRTPEELEYYFDTQTAGLSHDIQRIDKMLNSIGSL